MDDLFSAIRESLRSGNFHAALFMSATIPDICVALKNGKTDGNKYIAWFESNLPEYKGYMSGKDCYAFRCAILHEGKDDILDHHDKKDYIDKFIILTSNKLDSCHISSVGNLSYATGPQPNRMFINIHKFCHELIEAADKYIHDNGISTDKLITFHDKYNDGIVSAE